MLAKIITVIVIVNAVALLDDAISCHDFSQGDTHFSAVTCSDSTPGEQHQPHEAAAHHCHMGHCSFPAFEQNPTIETLFPNQTDLSWIETTIHSTSIYQALFRPPIFG